MKKITLRIPVKKVNKVLWGVFYDSGAGHELVTYRPTISKENFPFTGGHRMRKVKIKDDFYWRIPKGTIDISDVPPARPPRRSGKTGR